MTTASELAESLNQPLGRCETALRRCDNDTEAATDYLLTHEEESDEFWRDLTPPPPATQFSRWGENFAVVDEETLSSLLAECVASGKPFSDPDFPPSDSSLFFDVESARTTWRCHDCNKNNPMPSDSVIEQYRRSNPSRDEIRKFFSFIAQTNPMLAVQMQANPQMATQLLVSSLGGGGGPPPPLQCGYCKGQFPLGLLESKPSQWLRPTGVRDDVTIQYGAGAPWQLIRDFVRPDDVRQGAVGNCWFVGALSILAHQKPHLVKALFPFNQDFSEYGVYLVRLCKDGVWRNVIVDDMLPCNRDARLAYTTAARRQLWVPLIEKAAAKLCGCYEGMHSGTLCEAFSLLTGLATDRELLISELTAEESETLWARAASAQSEGFLIGLACAAKQGTTSKQLQDLGLQCPHAYIVMDTREVAGSGERILLLGNPWGERSPSTWKGRWGNATAEYKEGVKSGALPDPGRDVANNGQFWIPWSDVLKYFASIEFCRTADSDLKQEVRVRGWLPAITGLGDAFELETGPSTNGKVRVDLSLYQESHSVRESAKGGSSTNVDLGFVVLRSAGGGAGVAVATNERKAQPEVSQELLLDADCTYIVVPISFSNVYLQEHRKLVVAVRSGSAAILKRVDRIPNTAELLRLAVRWYCTDPARDRSSKELFPGLTYSFTKDSCGAIIGCENSTTCMFTEVMLDGDDSKNVNSTRGGMLTRDVIPPGREVVIMVLTPKPGSRSYSLSVSVACARRPDAMQCSFFPPLGEGADSPAILALHEPFRVPGKALLSVAELIKRNMDPIAAPALARLAFKQQQDVQRLYREYLDAGIEPTEAMNIAKEEAEHLYQ